MCIVIGFAALGALATAAAGSEPGFLLGAFVVVGTIVAGLAVTPRAVYLIIPAPALCYLVAAGMAGLIHDRAASSSNATLAISGAQWVASGFLAMCLATLVAVGLTVARWPRRQRNDWDDEYPPEPAHGDRRPPPRSRRPALRD